MKKKFRWTKPSEALPDYDESVLVAVRAEDGEGFHVFFSHRTAKPDVRKDRNGFTSYGTKHGEVVEAEYWTYVPQPTPETLTRPVGSTFLYEGKRYRVVQDSNNLCSLCAFYASDDCWDVRPVRGLCGPLLRDDHKSVYFEEVTEKEDESHETE